MATAPEDLEVETPEIEEIEQPEQELHGEGEVTIDGEEPAEQGGEAGESAVIRDFRQREREKDRELRDLRQRVAAPPAQLPGDPGPEPTEEDFNWDIDRWKEALRKWHVDKTAFDAATREQTQRAEAVETARRTAYNAAKAAQPIAGIDAAEKRVFEQVPELMRNALLHAKSPAVVAALDKYPDRLNAIADTFRTDPAEALMMLGELRGKAKIMPARRAPDPEEISSGTGRISHSGGAVEKQLAKLEAEAEHNGGDRTKVIAFKKKHNL